MPRPSSLIARGSSVTAVKQFNGATGSTGSTGPVGPAGATGPAGPAGPAVTNASTLVTGTLPDAIFPAVLPAISGALLTGLTPAQIAGVAVITTDPRLSDARTPVAHNQAWSTITSSPTTLAGYGITDGVTTTDSRLSDARTPVAHNQAWSTITGTPTTLAGYGITDGGGGAAAAGTLTGTTLAANVVSSSLTSVGTLATLTVTASIIGSVTGNAATVTTNANLTGPVTSTGNATAIAANAILNAMINSLSASKLTGSLPAIDGSALTGITAGAAAAGTLTGTTLASNVVTSSLTRVGDTLGVGITAVEVLHIASASNAYIRSDSRVGGGAASASGWLMYDNTIRRWDFINNTSNDFKINRYDASAVFQDQPISISGSTGIVSILNIANRTSGFTQLLGTGSVVGISIDGTAPPRVGVNSGTTTLTSRFTVVGGTVTTNLPVISATQTWNASGVTFKGLSVVVTDTASAAASLPVEVLGGSSGATSLMTLNKAGLLTVPALTVNGIFMCVNNVIEASDGSSGTPSISFYNALDTGFFKGSGSTIGVNAGNVYVGLFTSTEFKMFATGKIGFSSSGAPVNASDTWLTRGANAANMRIGGSAWNASGTTFIGTEVIVTDTASAAGSIVFRAVGGSAATTTLFSVDKSGNAVVLGTVTGGLYNGQTISSAANFTGTVTALGKLMVSHSLTGDYGAGIYNTNATGYGLFVRGGNTTLYALAVIDYLGTTTAFTVTGSGNGYFGGTLGVTGLSSLNGGAVISGNAAFQITNTNAPSTGVGMEVYYHAGTGQVRQNAYDRGGSLYKSYVSDALDHAWNVSGTQKLALSSAGVTMPSLGAGGGLLSVGAADSGGVGFKLVRVPN